MTQFALPTVWKPPGAPTGAQWEWNVRVKTFEANTPALLETAMNNWLVTLPVGFESPGIIAVDYQSGAKERVLITYGYFSQV
jgi:hypothetical protein